MRPAWGWPGASVIDSPTWVVGGSDSSVAVETNSELSNQSELSESPGDSSNTCWRFPQDQNTHKHTHTHIFFYVAYGFVGYTSVYVLRFICVHVRMHVCVCGLTCVELMCVFSPCGVVFFRHRLWVVDMVVMGECSLDVNTHKHTHTHHGTGVSLY